MPRKMSLLVPGALVSLDGYRKDGKCRPVAVEEVKGSLLVCRCLLRSTPLTPVYRSYKCRLIDGVRPLVGVED